MDEIRWRKSTCSSNGGASCIEVGQATRIIAVRDTKQHGQGPVLRFTPAAWRRFAEQVKGARSLATDPAAITPVTVDKEARARLRGGYWRLPGR